MTEEKTKVGGKTAETKKRGPGRPKGSGGKYKGRKSPKKSIIPNQLSASQIKEIIELCKQNGIKVFNYRDLYISFVVKNDVTSKVEHESREENIDGTQQAPIVQSPKPADPPEPPDPGDEFPLDDEDIEELKITDPVAYEKFAMGEGLDEKPQRT